MLVFGDANVGRDPFDVEGHVRFYNMDFVENNIEDVTKCFVFGCRFVCDEFHYELAISENEQVVDVRGDGNFREGEFDGRTYCP